MLRIPENIAIKARDRHYAGVRNWVEKSLQFYIDLLNDSIKENIEFKDNTLKAMLSCLLSRKDGKGIKPSDLLLYINHDKSIILKCESIKLDFLNLLVFFNKNLKIIITGTSQELQTFIKNTDNNYTNFKNGEKEIIDEVLTKIFNYDKLTKKGFKNKNGDIYQAYDLTDAIGIKTCCYCNRLYANTILKQNKEANKTERIIRPTLDHFFDKDTYPYLAISFYNLIPSCTPCNSKLKHTKTFDLKNYLHPYTDVFSEYGKFSYFPQTVEAAYGMTEDIKVDILSKDGDFLNVQKSNDIKMLGSRNVFKFDVIYSEHADIIQDLLLKSIKTNRNYLNNLNDVFNLELNDTELYRIAFGVFPEEKDLHKRPFSVLINDIAKELELINDETAMSSDTILKKQKK